MHLQSEHQKPTRSGRRATAVVVLLTALLVLAGAGGTAQAQDVGRPGSGLPGIAPGSTGPPGSGLPGPPGSGLPDGSPGSGLPGAAPEPVPCTPAGDGRYDCTFYMPGNGRSGGSPVQASDGEIVGYLREGVNWVECMRVGGSVTQDESVNDTWAWTLADDGENEGWVNAVYARGGEDNGRFEGVPWCSDEHGEPPAGDGEPQPGERPPVEEPPLEPPPPRKMERESCGDRTDLRVRPTSSGELWSPDEIVVVGTVQNCVVQDGSYMFGRTVLRMERDWRLNVRVVMTTTLHEGGEDTDGRPGGEDFHSSEGHLAVSLEPAEDASYHFSRAFGPPLTGSVQDERTPLAEPVVTFETRAMRMRPLHTYTTRSEVTHPGSVAFTTGLPFLSFAGWAPTFSSRLSDDPLSGTTLSWSGGILTADLLDQNPRFADDEDRSLEERRRASRAVLKECVRLVKAAEIDPVSCLREPIFITGDEESQAADHDRDAMDPDQRGIPGWVRLRYEDPNTKRPVRGWQLRDPRCKPSQAPKNQCDEYPFFSTVQGGQKANPPPSLRWINARHNGRQGTWLGKFYRRCDLKNGVESFLSVPAPANTLTKTQWTVCNGTR